MPPAPNRPSRPPSASRATQQDRYRDELARLTAVLQLAEAQAMQAKADIARALPQTLAYGVPMDQVAAITEISRATLYRMLDDAAKLQNMRRLVQQLEALIRQSTLDLGRPCLPQELADRRNVTVDGIQHDLILVHSLLRDDLVKLHKTRGPAAKIRQVDLPAVELKILKMLLDQGKSKGRIAGATGLTENEVVARGSLALLRLGPAIRSKLREAASLEAAPVASP